MTRRLALAAAVKDWNDPDEMERPNGAEEETYLASGLSVGPGNHSFVMVDEILQVLGMSWELYQEIDAGPDGFLGSRRAGSGLCSGRGPVGIA